MKILKLHDIDNFIVISDVHLRDPVDNLTQLFISTLKSLPTSNTIFLLGDIFDFIAVKSPYFFKLWKNVFQTFQSLKEKGYKIYFIEGNHDFGFEHFKSSFLDKCFTNYGDFIIEFNHKDLGLVHLRHGDNVVCKSNYLKFRCVVKSKIFQLIISKFFCGILMHYIFSRYAILSRKKDVYRTLPEDFLRSCIIDTLNSYRTIKTLIIGHIHIDRDFTINNVRFLVGPDWFTNPSYLAYDNKKEFERVYLNP